MIERYLDEEGLERLVEYIQNGLNSKLGRSEQITLPEDLVHENDINGFLTDTEILDLLDLNDYAKKTDIPAEQDLSGYALSEDVAATYASTQAMQSYVQNELESYATDEDLELVRGLVTGVYHFRGSVDNLAALQEIQNPAVGDVYNIADTGMNAGWTGEVWDEFASQIDLTPYLLKEDIGAIPLSEVDRILYSGAAAVAGDRVGVEAMIANDKPEVEITLAKNLATTTPIVIPEGKKVVMDLGGKAVSGNVPFQVDGGELVLSNGTVNAGTDARRNAVEVSNGGTLVLDGATINSTKNQAVQVNGGNVVINSGNINGQESGIAMFGESSIEINGGVIAGIDNGAVMGNGTAGKGGAVVVMNGGRLEGHIQSAGYIACAVYMPNEGSFTMNDGEIVSDGCGICMRGGQVNLNGGSIVASGASGIKGKVGDSRVVVGPYAVVYDAQSKYPAVDSLELNIAAGMVLEGTDGDIDTVLESGREANINDLR